MGQTVSLEDFDWQLDSEEPHAVRRKEILKQHPEIKSLMAKTDYNMVVMTYVCVIAQLVTSYMVKDASWFNVILLAYTFGGCMVHLLWSIVHEASHRTLFGRNRPLANTLTAMVANTPIGFPMAVTFKRYHMLHHRYQGDGRYDVDLPTYFEAKIFSTTLGKIAFCFLQPVCYYVRPIFMLPMVPTMLELVNVAQILAVNYAVAHYWGAKAFFYLLGGSLLTLGFHPLGAHFIADHYLYEKGSETYSYYGWLNMFVFNGGYHNEHHDFPSVPGGFLPEVKKLAPEFYTKFTHESWWTAMIKFIKDKDMGMYSRRVREIPTALKSNKKDS